LSGEAPTDDRVAGRVRYQGRGVVEGLFEELHWWTERSARRAHAREEAVGAHVLRVAREPSRNSAAVVVNCCPNFEHAWWRPDRPQRAEATAGVTRRGEQGPQLLWGRLGEQDLAARGVRGQRRVRLSRRGEQARKARGEHEHTERPSH
jgi:hypothetical protein